MSDTLNAACFSNKSSLESRNLIFSNNNKKTGKTFFLLHTKTDMNCLSWGDNSQPRSHQTMRKQPLVLLDSTHVFQATGEKQRKQNQKENYLDCLSSGRNLSISLRKGINLHQQFPFVWISCFLPSPHPLSHFPHTLLASNLGTYYTYTPQMSLKKIKKKKNNDTTTKTTQHFCLSASPHQLQFFPS